MVQMVKNLPAMQETQVRSLGWEDPLEVCMTIHSSILAWRIPWIEEPGGLQSMGSQRIRHDWATNTFTFFIICYFSVCIPCAVLYILVAYFIPNSLYYPERHEHCSYEVILAFCSLICVCTCLCAHVCLFFIFNVTNTAQHLSHLEETTQSSLVRITLRNFLLTNVRILRFLRS